jgi:hypothetical protein
LIVDLLMLPWPSFSVERKPVAERQALQVEWNARIAGVGVEAVEERYGVALVVQSGEFAMRKIRPQPADEVADRVSRRRRWLSTDTLERPAIPCCRPASTDQTRLGQSTTGCSCRRILPARRR